MLCMSGMSVLGCIPVNRPDLGGTVPILEHLSRCPSLCHDFRLQY